MLKDIVFTDYTEQSTLQEMVRRLGGPLSAARLTREAAQSHRSLAEQIINLSEERFAVYVPATRPLRGYGVIVFVPPWQDARVPMGWASVLDRFGFIFVSAARSGNQENPIGRRIPLALLAAHNIVHRYDIDAERSYVAGFSGGSRLAMRLALAYPDLFRGALLNAGSDPIGDSSIPLPPRELLDVFQRSSRIVYATGMQDANRAAEDQISMNSMKYWCMTNVDRLEQPLLSHEVLPASALAPALESLMRRPAPETGKFLRCRDTIESALASRVERASKLKADGNQKALEREIKELDDRFGGLAAPAIQELIPDHSP